MKPDLKTRDEVLKAILDSIDRWGDNQGCGFFPTRFNFHGADEIDPDEYREYG